MVYRKTKQRVRRIYSRGKSIFSTNIFKNSIAVGLLTGVAKNALSGKKIIDIENIKSRISKMDGTNPLILLGAGILAKNPLITAIGLFGIVDPPDGTEKNKDYTRYSNIGENEGYSNVGETQESTEYSNVGGNEELPGYSNVGEIEKTQQKKRCIF